MDPSKDGGESPALPTDEANAATAEPAADVVAPETDANAAESSPAGETDANRVSLLSVVKDALEPKAPVAASSTAEGVDGPAKEEAAAAEAAAAEAEADDSALPFHNHPRWQQVLRERDALRPDAESYQAIETFLQDNGVTAEEAAEGYQVMALLKRNDPASLQQALEWFEPRVQALRDALGADLPADLQQRVDDGELDADVAAELAASRATLALSARAEEAGTRRSEEARQAEAVHQAATAVVTAVDQWEAQIKKTDPDYAKKAEMVATTITATMATSPTAEEAVKIAQAAYEKVNGTFAALRPPPKAVNTITPAGSSASNATQPATLREAIEASLAA
jgi:hypothetical protein